MLLYASVDRVIPAAWTNHHLISSGQFVAVDCYRLA